MAGCWLFRKWKVSSVSVTGRAGTWKRVLQSSQDCGLIFPVPEPRVGDKDPSGRECSCTSCRQPARGISPVRRGCGAPVRAGWWYWRPGNRVHVHFFRLDRCLMGGPGGNARRCCGLAHVYDPAPQVWPARKLDAGELAVFVPFWRKRNLLARFFGKPLLFPGNSLGRGCTGLSGW